MSFHSSFELSPAHRQNKAGQVRRQVTVTLACLAIGCAFPAAATTVVLDGAMQTYRAPDGSANYSEPSTVWGSFDAVVGLETRYPSFDQQFNGRFAATVEFNLGALPPDAFVSNAYLTLSPFFNNDSIDTLSSYVATSIAVAPARARGGNLITAFDVQDMYLSNPHPQLAVTSTVEASLSRVGSDPILGFAFEQVVDRCFTTGGNDCISSLGTGLPGDPRALHLTLTYEVPTALPPPITPVSEPANWAMSLGAMVLIGAALRRRLTGMNFPRVSR